MYRYLTKPGDGKPAEMIRWEIAERFGWTLEYIDALSLGEIHQLINVDDGRVKGRTSLLNRR